ncbi:MAG: WG repeat-containing protein [Defluviitaleaceae bacterium]|nr:WG repeat-containing protein [Defluviitaleaceae bacterium]
MKYARFHNTDKNEFSLGFVFGSKALIKIHEHIDYQYNFINNFQINDYLKELFKCETSEQLFEKTKVEKNDRTYLPPFWFNNFNKNCNNRLIQIEMEGKWGYCNIDTGDIVIAPTYDFSAPFYNGYALVRLGCENIEGARSPFNPGNVLKDKKEWHLYNWKLSDEDVCGYINTIGEIIIPIEYYDGNHYVENDTFIIKKKNKYLGVINKKNEIILDFDWEYIERVNKLDNKTFDGFLTYSEKNKGKYYKHTIEGKFLGSSKFNKSFENSILFIFGEQQHRIVKKNKNIYSVENGIVSETPFNYVNLLPIFKSGFEKFT